MSTETANKQETLSKEVPICEVPTPPTDLVFDDGESLETNRHRIAMNVLIRSLKHGWTERQDFLWVGISLSTTALSRLAIGILRVPISL